MQPEDAPYDIVMDTKLGGNRAYFAVLDSKEPSGCQDCRFKMGALGCWSGRCHSRWPSERRCRCPEAFRNGRQLHGTAPGSLS